MQKKSKFIVSVKL